MSCVLRVLFLFLMKMAEPVQLLKGKTDSLIQQLDIVGKNMLDENINKIIKVLLPDYSQRFTEAGLLFDYSERFKSSSEKTIDTSSLDMNKVWKTSSMFQGCEQLTSLDCAGWFSSGFLREADYMFAECGSLTNIDVSKWNTSSLTNAEYMFYECPKLKKVDVSHWDTSSLTNAEQMFRGCKELTELDASNWNTSLLTKAALMFACCDSLRSVNLSKWDTSSLTEIYNLFGSSPSLKTIDISNWRLSSTCDVETIFAGCHELETLIANGATIKLLVNTRNLEYSAASSLGDNTVYECSFSDGSGYTISSVKEKL